MDTEKILANLRLARTVIEATPAGTLYLGAWKTEEQCGTLHCAAGHLTNHPHFAEFMWLRPELNVLGEPMGGAWNLAPVLKPYVEDDYERRWLDEHFGPYAYFDLFCPRDESSFDRQYPDKVVHDDGEFSWSAVPSNVSDKALALWRIECQIEMLS